MTYRETIEGPLPSTPGSALGERLCWKITSATLHGKDVRATLAMPGIDWMRLGTDGIWRQDLRVQLLTDDGTVILMHYDTGMIRSTDAFLSALASGAATTWADQYMRVTRIQRAGWKIFVAHAESFHCRGQAFGPWRDRIRNLHCDLAIISRLRRLPPTALRGMCQPRYLRPGHHGEFYPAFKTERLGKTTIIFLEWHPTHG